MFFIYSVLFFNNSVNVPYVSHHMVFMLLNGTGVSFGISGKIQSFHANVQIFLIS